MTCVCQCLSNYLILVTLFMLSFCRFEAHEIKKVQVGNDQEMAQSERESLSKHRGGKKLN